MNWYKTAMVKFLSTGVAICEHCQRMLTPVNITENPRHIYNVGQEWECGCKKSKIWTNSIRNENALLDFLDGKSKLYYQGFCNDMFCPSCWGYIQPVKNGISVPWTAQSLDRYGCRRCKDNQDIAFNLSGDTDESGNVQHLIKFYSGMRKYWEKFVDKFQGSKEKQENNITKPFKDMIEPFRR